jgi:rSAM/selenodomain-associated transferase 1
MQKTTLAVMARAPLPGVCKTRLAATIGEDAAAVLYRAMLLDTLDALATCGADRLVVMAAPEHDGVARLTSIVPKDWEVQAQRGGDLGARLLHALQLLNAGGEYITALCSSDSPLVPVDAIAEALPTLDDDCALLGPGADGGCYLLSVPRADSLLFEGIPWKTREVADTTRTRLFDRGFDVLELPEAIDVDVPSDIELLREALYDDPDRAWRCAELLGALR